MKTRTPALLDLVEKIRLASEANARVMDAALQCSYNELPNHLETMLYSAWRAQRRATVKIADHYEMPTLTESLSPDPRYRK